MPAPLAHLLVKSYSTDAVFRAFALAANAATARNGGLTYLNERMHFVAVLEPTSRGCHLWAAQFATPAARDAAWTELSAHGWVTELTAEEPPVILAINGLPPEGLEDDAVPTAANVTPPPSAGPRAYMLIEGTPEDQDRINNYRDVILPMLKERGGYYTIFELGASLTVLSGQWTDMIIAISRWPDIDAAYDFWLSDRYQSVAIPMRTGAGRFSVLLADGIAG
jgi:uncharacterized protein (DUF1330 family)